MHAPFAVEEAFNFTVPELYSGADPYIIGVISKAEDPSGATYAVQGGVNSPFTIVLEDGQYKLALKANSTLNYETISGHLLNVRIVINHSEGPDYRDAVVNVTDVNEAPRLTVPTDPTPPTVLDGTPFSPFLYASIQDEDFGDELTVTVSVEKTLGAFDNLGAGIYDSAAGTYVITGSATDVQAAIQALQFIPRERTVEAGATENIAFTIKVEDKAGLSDTKTVNFVSSTQNRIPTHLALSSHTITESASVVTVGTLSATDTNGDTLSYVLVNESGTEEVTDAFFKIVSTEVAGKLIYQVVTKATTMVHQTTNHDIWVKVSDGHGGTAVQKFTITIKNANAPPSNISLDKTSVEELSTNNTIVGTLTTIDADGGDTAHYQLVDDADGRFVLNGNKIVVANGVKLDYEQAKAHLIKVKVTDSSGASYEKTFQIDVTDVSPEIARGTSTADEFVGGAGDDKLYGGLGNDVLTGGAGKDIFVFNSAIGNNKTNKLLNLDTITDFTVKDDTFWLDNAIFKKLGKKGSEDKPAKLDKKFFVIGTKAKDKNDYLVYDKKKGVLYYDADGSGKGKAVEIAKLSKNLKLTDKDFFVI